MSDMHLPDRVQNKHICTSQINMFLGKEIMLQHKQDPLMKTYIIKDYALLHWPL